MKQSWQLRKDNVEDLIKKVDRVMDRNRRTGDILEDRLLDFYWTLDPFIEWRYNYKFWHEEGIRIGEA